MLKTTAFVRLVPTFRSPHDAASSASGSSQ